MKITQANLEDLDQLVAIFENYRVFYRKSPDIDGSTAFLKERLTNQDSVIYIAKDQNGQIAAFTQCTHLSRRHVLRKHGYLMIYTFMKTIEVKEYPKH